MQKDARVKVLQSGCVVREIIQAWPYIKTVITIDPNNWERVGELLQFTQGRFASFLDYTSTTPRSSL